MSKMKMPDMDVVRFQESDVIVASTATKLMLVNYGDATRLNGYVKINGIGYGATQEHTLEEAYSKFGNFNEGTSFSWDREGGDGTNTFSAILEGDNRTGGETPGLDGVYYWRDGAFYDRQ